MDARLFNPILGVAIAVSISLAAQAQYYPAGPMAMPQQMMILPPAMPSSMPMMAGPPMGMPVMVPGATVGNGGPMMASAPMMRGAANAGKPPRQQRGQAVAESDNFIVFASDKAWAEQVAKTAEEQRSQLAQHWLGAELPPWSGRCPIHVHDAPELGAGGETRFIVERGVAHNWLMSVQGTRERILDSVLPHEISHTIFATHFGRLNKYVPRWADEGAATTVEHEAEKSKHRFYLKKFLQTGRGLAFNKMFQLKEYPKDILPLYAQGHSAVQFLIDQSDPRHFIQFLELGMQTENWPAALAKFYEYESIGDFQARWNKWLFDGSPEDIVAYAPLLIKQQRNPIALASATQQSSAPRQSTASGIVDPGRLSSDPRALDLLPSHSTTAPSNTSLAARAEPQNDANNALGSEPPASQPGSLLSMEDAITLASQHPTANPTIQQAENSSSESESWYKRKLRQASGQPATPIPQHNSFPGEASTPTNSLAESNAANVNSASSATTTIEGGLAASPMVGLRPSSSSPRAASSTHPPAASSSGTSTASPQQSQGVSVQVLEWGPSPRFSGLRSDKASYR